ncbi:MAG: hypothetical protein QM775_18015 [Pirellulales bacterium]
MNSADGGIAGNALPRGFYINTDQDSTLDETVGVVTLGSGASYVTLEATTTSDDSDIIMSDLVSPITPRSTSGAPISARPTLRTINSASASPPIKRRLSQRSSAGGAAGTQNISIVPWGVGDTLARSLWPIPTWATRWSLTSAATGFRPLDFATEYDTLALAAATDNVLANRSRPILQASPARRSTPWR